jgi:hypothetical protein
VIAKIVRGERVQGLIRYLYGPGRFNVHRDPHIVCGFDDPSALEPALRPDGERDFRHLDGLMQQPLALLGTRNYTKPVWHLSVRAHPDDPVLADDQWADIAGEIMHRTGLAPFEDAEAVRWFAVRHADDHIHIVATLARQDGTRPYVWNDAYRVRDACRAVERRYGLRRTSPADRTVAKHAKRGEIEKARRHKKTEPARGVLRRHVMTAAASAHGERQFFELLEAEGVQIRKRRSGSDSRQVTGYAVALLDDLDGDGEPVWYGGGKLASDLTLPRLRGRWADSSGPRTEPSPFDRVPVGRHLSERSRRVLLRSAVRRAAAQSRNTAELLGRLEAKGFMVKRQISHLEAGEVGGYAIAVPEGTGDREPAWYEGGRLADDLTLPCLKERWRGHGSFTDGPGELAVEERQAICKDAAKAVAYATAQIRRHVATNPHAARDVCWAASDVLHVAAQASGSIHLRRAADAYDRAARPPYGRLPAPTAAGNGLRTAARLLALTRSVGGTTDSAVVELVRSFGVLVDSIAQLHRMQGRDTQEAAARSARSHLDKAAPRSPSTNEWLSDSLGQATPAAVALSGFPNPWAPMRRDGLPQPLARPPRRAAASSDERHPSR